MKDERKERLIRELASNDRCVRLAAEEALQRHRPAPVDELIDGLRRDPRTAKSAMRVLVALGDSRAVAPLIDVLRQPEFHNIRLSAAEVLGLLNDARAVEPLIALLNQATRDRRTCDYNTDPSQLKEFFSWTTFVETSITVAEGLGRLADARAAEPLFEALDILYDSIYHYEKREEIAVRTVTDALVRFTSLSVESLVRKLESGYFGAKRAAAHVLGTRRARGAVGPLLTLLSAEQAIVAMAARSGFG